MILIKSFHGILIGVGVLVIFRKCESKSQILDIGALLWGVGSKSGFCGFLIKMVLKIKGVLFKVGQLF